MSLLEVTAVAKSYGPVVALRSADLRVEAGEIHALMGANGAGKSTLVKILTGVIARDSGEIAVDGRPVTIGSPRRAREVGLAPVFQDPALLPDLTVRQNLRLTGADAKRVFAELDRMDLTVDPTELVADLPEGNDVRRYAETQIERLDRLGHASSKADEGPRESPARLGWDELPSAAPADRPLPRRA